MMTDGPARGVCVWLTGPSAAGKSTLTRALVPLLEQAGRTVTVLDVVPLLARAPGERSSEAKLLRKAYVASEVVRHGGVAICVTVSASRQVRESARAVVGAEHFVEVLVDAPTDVRMARRAERTNRPSPVKRLRRWRRRVVQQVLPGGGVVHEAPLDPALVVDTTTTSVTDGATAVYRLLVHRGDVVDRAGPRPVDAGP